MDNIKEDIFQCGGVEGYLFKQQYKSLLQFLTCGSVDDGKSTLIGRLLYDSFQVYDDQLPLLYKDNQLSNQNNYEILNFAGLVDGLQDEREQGITIDVAYRYFFTKHRKFIIADAPGHEEYTRNMITAASTSNLAILLVDVRKGIRAQTRRHTFIVTLLGIKNLIIAINKMDLVDYSENVFEEIKKDYLTFVKCFGIALNIQFIPISALHGDNVINRSKYMIWYNGLTLINILDTIQIVNPVYDYQYLRFPVQYVNYGCLGFHGYSGTIASGELSVGKKVRIFPSGDISTINRIITFNGDLERAFIGSPVTIVLENSGNINRGDLFLDINDSVVPVNNAQVDVVWMGCRNLISGMVFNVQVAHRRVRAYVKNIYYRVDINNSRFCISDSLPLNSIGLVELVFDGLMILDQYNCSPITGSMIFIDLETNFTLGAGMVRMPLSKFCDEHVI